MIPYGMKRVDERDDDVHGCCANGRATGVYNVRGPGGDARAYRGLRRCRKAAVRRHTKRVARAEGKAAIRGWMSE